jgi:hypothetical protein
MSGIFSLQEVRTEQIKNVSQGLELSLPGREYGYYGGGWNGTTNFSTIDRIDFSNETVICTSIIINSSKIWINSNLK